MTPRRGPDKIDHWLWTILIIGVSLFILWKTGFFQTDW